MQIHCHTILYREQREAVTQEKSVRKIGSVQNTTVKIQQPFYCIK